ncbi:ankyrin repeat domain-containing protein 27-like isoform X2 [Symsagittifera roscoffensis]|uniref:ankyrin repeat domain-containing protein 27-like isoform X2 n=1 Tax=Symsagittifera roscoffensis TaxID=84072 RepID=UPI00307C028B
MSLLDYDEDLSVNEFFVHLKTEYTSIFKDASTKRYTICVPRQGSFDVKSLTCEVISTHILKTRLDHQDIRASINTYSGKEVKLANGNLETISGFECDRRVKVLFEEDYVNEADHSYKVLCVDRPLEGDSWAHVANSELFTQRLTTQEQCMDFLWTSNTRKSKVKRGIDLLVSPVINSISSAESADQVVGSCSGLYQQALHNLLQHPHYRRHCKENHYYFQAVKLSLETYLMGLLHDSVFTKLFNLEKSAEVEFNKQYLYLADKVTHHTLQLDAKHCINLERSAAEVDQVVTHHCPLEMAYCLERSFSLLFYNSPTSTSHTSKRTATITSTTYSSASSPPLFRPKSSVAGGPTRKAFFPRGVSLAGPFNSADVIESSPDAKTETVVFSGDQLLPLTVLLILNSRVPCWLTLINYIKNYRLSESRNSQVEYAITNFEAAIMIIQSGDLKRDAEKEQHLGGNWQKSALKLPKPRQNVAHSVSKSHAHKDSNWTSNALMPLGSPSTADDTDSGLASDDMQTSSIDDDSTSKATTVGDSASETSFIPSNCSDGNETNNGDSVFDGDGELTNSLSLSIPMITEDSPINRLFRLIKDDKREEMAELLEGEGGDSLIERLCHPLCACAKCQLIKGTPNGITNGVHTSEGSVSSADCLGGKLASVGEREKDRVSSSSRNENGWTALHAAAFYGNQYALERLVNLDYAVSPKTLQGLTPLHLACMEGHQSICMLLMYYGAPVNAVDKQGNTGLHIACLNGNIHVVTALLYQPGAAEPLNVNAQNILHETPIFLAAKFGYVEIVRELLDFGADISLENAVGEGPVQVCLDNEIRLLLLGGSQTAAFTKWSDDRLFQVNQQLQGEYEESVTNDSPTASTYSFVVDKVSANLKSTRLSLPNGPLGGGRGKVSSSMNVAPENETRTEYSSQGSPTDQSRNGSTGRSVYSETLPRTVRSEAMTSSREGVGRQDSINWRRSRFAKSQSHSCLSSEHQNPSWFYSHQTKDQYDRKVKLMLQRVRSNDIDKVLFLLGAAVKSGGGGGNDQHQPTLYTHSLCHPKCDCNPCQQLRKDARDPPHKYTLTVNSQSDPSEGGLSPLHAAVISGLPEMCVVLLNQGANVDLHAPPSMNTPLHFACQYNRAEIASLLFEYGAQGNIPNREQNTALHLAASCGHEWPVNLLSSVLSPASLSSRNNKGNTPLHLAASRGFAEVTKCLLDSGADANIRNEMSFTPLECAIMNSEVKVSLLLSPMTSTSSRSLDELLDVESEFQKAKNNPAVSTVSTSSTVEKMTMIENDVKIEGRTHSSREGSVQMSSFEAGKSNPNKIDEPSDDNADLKISTSVCEEESI